MHGARRTGRVQYLVTWGRVMLNSKAPGDKAVRCPLPAKMGSTDSSPSEGRPGLREELCGKGTVEERTGHMGWSEQGSLVD